MGDTSRNVAQSFEEMVESQVEEKDVQATSPEKKKLNFWQTLFAWWSK